MRPGHRGTAAYHTRGIDHALVSRTVWSTAMRESSLTRKRISRAELHAFYVEQDLTIAEVATRYGVGATTISRRLKDVNIQARRRGPRARSDATLGPLEWTADRAYAVGLIATDGNLSRKPFCVSITSIDVDLLETVRTRLALDAPIKPHGGGYGQRCHRLAWSDARFYTWLLDIGLTPAKSLTIGALAIPNDYFADFCAAVSMAMDRLWSTPIDITLTETRDTSTIVFTSRSFPQVPPS